MRASRLGRAPAASALSVGKAQAQRLSAATLRCRRAFRSLVPRCSEWKASRRGVVLGLVVGGLGDALFAGLFVGIGDQQLLAGRPSR